MLKAFPLTAFCDTFQSQTVFCLQIGAGQRLQVRNSIQSLPGGKLVSIRGRDQPHHICWPSAAVLLLHYSSHNRAPGLSSAQGGTPGTWVVGWGVTALLLPLGFSRPSLHY